jgi:hypothetical protein
LHDEALEQGHEEINLNFEGFEDPHAAAPESEAEPVAHPDEAGQPKP